MTDKCPNCGWMDFGWRTDSGGFSCGRCGYELGAEAMFREFVLAKARIEAAKKLCEIYFDIASAYIGEDEVCIQRDERIAKEADNG